MAGLCVLSVLNCGHIVTQIVSGRVYYGNSWILHVHLQISLVVAVIFVLKVYCRSRYHDMVELCLRRMLEMQLQEQHFPFMSYV